MHLFRKKLHDCLACADKPSMDVSSSVKILPLISVIPVVIYAIWADGFERRVRTQVSRCGPLRPPSEISASDTDEDEENTQKSWLHPWEELKVAGIFGLFLQVTAFIMSAEIRDEAPLTGLVTALAGILAQNLLQARVDRFLRENTLTPSQRREKISLLRSPRTVETKQPTQVVPSLARESQAFFWAAFGALLYIACFLVPVMGTLLLGGALKASPQMLTLLMGIASVFGMFLGLGSNFALTPFYLKRTLPTEMLEKGEARELLETCFRPEQHPVLDFWVIQSDLTQKYDSIVMVAGIFHSKFTPQFLRPGLFISRAVINKLEPRELHAVICHEASHIVLKHLKNRVLLTCGLIFGISFLMSALLWAFSIFIHAQSVQPILGVAGSFVAFFGTLKVLSHQSRSQEWEADFHAVIKLGADPSALAAALRKMENPNTGHLIQQITHPATEARISLLEKLAEIQAARRAQEKQEETKKAA